MRRMSRDEKLRMLGGRLEFRVRGVERLGVPDIIMSDGGAGVTAGEASTAYPAPICLAATWNRELAERVGAAMAGDCRARGVHVLLAPAVNICRSPLCGRNFEYLGEDPFLSSEISASLARGIQSGGVAATVKHFAANNQEYDRHGTSSEVDERTLREIYLPAFEAAVTEAEAACVMSAYNKLNGVYCTENRFLNVETLKGEWSFDGILMSDWGATHNALRAAEAGLDLEMPRARHMSPDSVLRALRSGALTDSVVDDKVRRILGTIVRMGFADRDQADPSAPLDDPLSAAAALDVAREGIVLLKNEGGVLPIDREEVRTILVVGPNAMPTPHAGGGSSYVDPFRAVSILEGVREIAGKGLAARGPVVEHVERDELYVLELVNEQSFEESVFHHRDAARDLKPGLRAEYYGNPSLDGEPLWTEVVERVNFNWGGRGPGEPSGPGGTLDSGGGPYSSGGHGPGERGPAERLSDGFSVRLTGLIVPETSGPHILTARADDAMRVFLEDEPLIEGWAEGSTPVGRVRRELKAGGEYAIRIEYREEKGAAEVGFGWSPLRVEEDVIERICDRARSADVVIACVGFDRHTEKEGKDRSYRLPGLQEMLLDRVLDANPRSIVIVNSGSGVRTAPWIHRAAAVLQAWYAGQEGGTAIAEMLFGEVNPSGKLPVTFERRYEDVPSADHYHPEDGKTYYREGLFVGYRGFDAAAAEPLFPFGHGLSYTTFSYEDLEITPSRGDSADRSEESSGGPGPGAALERLEDAKRSGGTPRADDDGGPDRPVVVVSFVLKNTGRVPGAETAQLYVRDVEASVPRPHKELKGFEKVFLAPGESRSVAIALCADAFSFWDPGERAWRVELGTFEILVGASAGDIRLLGSYTY